MTLMNMFFLKNESKRFKNKLIVESTCKMDSCWKENLGKTVRWEIFLQIFSQHIYIAQIQSESLTF